MIYAVIGTGAVGGYYGLQLQQGGAEVHFLAHSDYHQLQEKGLTLVTQGKQQGYPVKVYEQSSQMPLADVIIVALKTVYNHKLPALLAPILKADSLVVLLQNGLGMEQDLQTAMPELSIAAACANIFVTKTQPAHIEHYALGGLSLSDYSCRSPQRMASWVQDLKKAGLDCRIGEYHATRWKKAIWNVAFNGLSAVEQLSPRQLVATTDYQQRAQLIMEEVRVLAKAHCATNIASDFVERNLKATAAMPSLLPSMYYDRLHRRAMELYYLYELPLSWAAQQRVPMPHTQQLYERLKNLDPTDVLR